MNFNSLYIKKPPAPLSDEGFKITNRPQSSKQFNQALLEENRQHSSKNILGKTVMALALLFDIRPQLIKTFVYQLKTPIHIARYSPDPPFLSLSKQIDCWLIDTIRQLSRQPILRISQQRKYCRVLVLDQFRSIEQAPQ
jgi:hypothetical protein